MAIDWQESTEASELLTTRELALDLIPGMKLAENHTCPRCGGGVPNDAQRGAYPGALSRWDNETEVCSQCGQDEAMIQFMANLAHADPQFAVRPEARPWVQIPA